MKKEIKKIKGYIYQRSSVLKPDLSWPEWVGVEAVLTRMVEKISPKREGFVSFKRLRDKVSRQLHARYLGLGDSKVKTK